MKNIEHILPENIEKRSFEIITKELSANGIILPSDRDFVIKRAIHTTADFDYANTMRFSDNAIGIMEELIRNKAHIVTDTNMTLSGISKVEFAKYGGELHCFMADGEIADEAKRRGMTRASVSMEKAAKIDAPVIFAVGNAPTALISLRDMYDSNVYRASFVIGVPVGFVNVEISKELIMDTNIPYIVNAGRKGGSNVAAAIVNAVLYHMRDNEV